MGFYRTTFNHLLNTSDLYYNQICFLIDNPCKPLIMIKKEKTSEGPACACGRGDLYMESIKQKEIDKNETIDSSTLNQDINGNRSIDPSENAGQKP